VQPHLAGISVQQQSHNALQLHPDHTARPDRQYHDQELDEKISSMEHHQPWLAPFVISGLINALDHIEGKSTPDYDIKSLQDKSKLDIHQKAPCVGYAIITDVSILSLSLDGTTDIH
jgi:hypothetical protein